MFKVICIDAKADPNGFSFESKVMVEEGCVYDVIMETQGRLANGQIRNSYILSVDPEYAYETKRFIPLSEIDELDLVNEKQLVNQ